MPTITISSYRIRFQDTAKKIYLKINDPMLDGVHAFFENYFGKLQTKKINDPSSKKVLSAKQVTSKSPNFEGLVITGEYGYETELLDVKGKKKPYQRSTTEAELLPFYFRYYIPKTGDSSVLLLQRFGTSGVRKTLGNNLLPEFEKQFSGVKLFITPLIPDGLLDKLMNGGLHAITLRKNTLPSDVCDQLNERSIEAGRMDVVITAKHGHVFSAILNKIKNILIGNDYAPIYDVIRIKGFAHDKTLVDIELGGKKRRIDLSNLTKLRAIIDITDDIKVAPNGHPEFESISSETKKIMNDIINTLRI
ncbi:hypothetical protein [Ereboglobus luteus]|uniref:hypothetical protein n=1 Tax=Ereboglobus luteus TaxID=1796921 RepID=UPI0012601BBB|nr:hypothetical protein [Ereboglobus luteus]